MLAFNHRRPLVAHMINKFWKNTAKAPIRKQFHPYIPSEVAVNEEVTWRIQAFIAESASWLLKGEVVMLK
jgi:hypothetical protein